MMMTLQELCMRKIVEAELPRDDLPQILQMDLKYFPGIRFSREGYPVFEHIGWRPVQYFFQNLNLCYDGENFREGPFPEALRDRWTRDLTAADLQNKMYIQLLDSQRLHVLIRTLAMFEYDNYEFMEEMIAEILSRNIAISFKEHFLRIIFFDYVHEYHEKLSEAEILRRLKHEYHEKLSEAEILRRLKHRTDEETLMRVRDVMDDIIQVIGDIVESEDDDDE